MDNNQTSDQDSVVEFVDMVLSQKYQDGPVPADERERAIQEINNEIANTIVGKLNKQQLLEYNALLAVDDASPEVYESFYSKVGLDLDTIIAQVYTNFMGKHAGGNNGQ